MTLNEFDAHGQIEKAFHYSFQFIIIQIKINIFHPNEFGIIFTNYQFHSFFPRFDCDN